MNAGMLVCTLIGAVVWAVVCGGLASQLAEARRMPAGPAILLCVLTGPLGIALVALIPTPEVQGMREAETRLWMRRHWGDAKTRVEQMAAEHEQARRAKKLNEEQEQQARERRNVLREKRDGEAATRKTERLLARQQADFERAREKERIATEKAILRTKPRPQTVACPGCGGRHTLLAGERAVCGACGTTVQG